ncbi:MAG: hypothetical protein HDR43_01390, partial [Mycoplasma sp.]|nr:hypothetical protein [Mycoplasma sp.]
LWTISVKDNSVNITINEVGSYTLKVGQASITIEVPEKPSANTPSFTPEQNNLKLIKIETSQRKSESKKWKVNIRGVNLPRVKEGNGANYSVINPENSETFIHNNGGHWSITKNPDDSISLFTPLESPKPGIYKLRIKNTKTLQEIQFIVDNASSPTLRESSSLIDKVVKNQF